MSIKFSALPVESTFSLSDYLIKVKAAGGGDVLVSLQNLINAFPIGYSLPLQVGAGINPADATVYYWGTGGSLVGGASTTNTSAHMFIPKSGHIVAAYGAVIVSTTLGTTEQGSIFVRLNDTTDTLVTNTQQFNAINNTFSNNSLNIAVSAGDFITAKVLTPTWATNPTNVYFLMSVFISA